MLPLTPFHHTCADATPLLLSAIATTALIANTTNLLAALLATPISTPTCYFKDEVCNCKNSIIYLE